MDEVINFTSAMAPVLRFWEALAAQLKGWLLSPQNFVSLANSSRMTLIPSAALLIYGLFAAFFGGRPIPFRIISVIPGLLLGWFIGGFIASLTGFPAAVLAYGLAGVLGFVGGYKPLALASLAMAILAGIFVYLMTAQSITAGEVDPLAGTALIFGGAIFAGTFAYILERVTTALVGAEIGAFCTVLGTLALARILHVNLPVMRHTYFVQGALGVIFVIGIIFQWRYASTAEEREAERVAKIQQSVREKEDRERNKRFENYGKKTSRKK